MALSLLVIEDDRDLRRAIARLLAHNGFAVAHAGTIEEAHRIEDHFHFGVFDLELPDGNTIGLAREMLAAGRLDKVVFFTKITDSRLDAARQVGTVVEKSEGVRALTEALINLVAQRRRPPVPRRRLSSQP